MRIKLLKLIKKPKRLNRTLENSDKTNVKMEVRGKNKQLIKGFKRNISPPNKSKMALCHFL